MNDQEILHNRPKGATHYDQFEYMKHVPHKGWKYWRKAGEWREGACFRQEIRSLADIKRIVNLELALKNIIDSEILDRLIDGHYKSDAIRALKGGDV